MSDKAYARPVPVQQSCHNAGDRPVAELGLPSARWQILGVIVVTLFAAIPALEFLFLVEGSIRRSHYRAMPVSTH
jgi:hypothetical protein